jgi:hypothetical protein
MRIRLCIPSLNSGGIAWGIYAGQLFWGVAIHQIRTTAKSGVKML